MGCEYRAKFVQSSALCVIHLESKLTAAPHIQNRVTAHSAILDWANGQRRHLARITPQAEPPTETPFEEVAAKSNGHANGHSNDLGA